jgi:hypothetical protein
MCKKFCKSKLHGLWDCNIWNKKKSFLLVPDRDSRVWPLLGQKNFNYANFKPSTISMHIMIGACVPNLRCRGRVEHTQMQLALKKGTKNFNYGSNSWLIFSEFTFLLDKNFNDWCKGPAVFQFYPFFFFLDEISKLHEEWYISPFLV